MLTQDNHWNHTEAALEMLMRYNKEGESFLSETVTSVRHDCIIERQNARAHPWCGKWLTKQRHKTLKKPRQRVKFQRPFSRTIKVFSYANIAREILLWLRHRISTYWFACKRPLRVNAPVCWSEKHSPAWQPPSSLSRAHSIIAQPTKMGCFPSSGVLARLGTIRLSPYSQTKRWFRRSTLNNGRWLQSVVAEFFAKQDAEWLI